MCENRIREVARRLRWNIYEGEFRGKPRGKFIITREQLKKSLGVIRLHRETIYKLQDYCLKNGIVIIDLDDIFPCIDLNIVSKYRKITSNIFDEYLSDFNEGPLETEDEEFSDDEEDGEDIKY